MTKFEEEFKALTSWDWVNVDLIQKILTKFGNWHSDEDFQIVEEIGGSFAVANKNLIDANTKLTEEIANLKSQLQQQALPVVPEWLDIEIKHFKSTSKHPTVDVVFGVADAIVAVKNGNAHSKLYDYLFCGKQDVCNQHQAIFALAFITGKYEVEKQQLFEVKMPIVYWDDDASQLTNGFDFLRIDKETDEVDFIGFLSNTKKHTVYFTEQEIKSIDERYWQFAVPVEDGE
ncbi:DUF1642 domain-containing protein [Lactococcus lactis]|uniref:DUF1642 domain-containing protein n=1 Tax=Lactococcus lactis TaxID=1358 RepID=UPI001C125712|nr:DUF1642 domain-containing protein [Lactococcus lactis]MBU5243738.1 DUF1642 domain-containing protein [Lactococcus lactis]